MKRDMKRDVFLCHASEDKVNYVRPLAQALTDAGVSCWLDEAEIEWGESIIRSINTGLREAQFVLVIVSKAFLAKGFPQAELESALMRHLPTGETRVLPLLVGHLKLDAALEDLELLRGTLWQHWNGDSVTLQEVVRAVLRKLHRNQQPQLAPHANSTAAAEPSIFGNKTYDANIADTMKTIFKLFQ